MALSLVVAATLIACGSDGDLATPDEAIDGSSVLPVATPDAPELVATSTPSTSAASRSTTTVGATMSTTRAGASPLLRSSPREPSAHPLETNAADLSGVLVIADGCLSIENELGITPIVWPFEATFDGSIIVTQIDDYTVGGSIFVAGGEVGDLASTVIPEHLDQATACSASADNTAFHAQVG